MKILVFGNSGSGKSTYAQRLAAKHGLSVLDLDNVVWSRTEFAVFRPDADITAELDACLRQTAAWIIEGCYGRWMEHLFPHCSEIIFMNPGEETCLRHCRARPWEPEKYPTQAAQDARLPQLLDWVRGYYTRTDDLSLAAHRRLFDSFTGMKRELTSTGDDPDALAPTANVSGETLETERLRLWPSDRETWAVLRQGLAPFTDKFDLRVAGGIRENLQPESRDALVADEWDSYFIVHRAERMLIGLCACRKEPDADGAVEIAYGIAPDFQGQGLATEAARALAARTLRRGDVRAASANTLPAHNASTRVLTKCGFVRAGETSDPDEGIVWRWELSR